MGLKPCSPGCSGGPLPRAGGRAVLSFNNPLGCVAFMEANAWLFFCRELLTQFLSVSLFILTGKDFFSVSLSCGF